MIWLCFSINYIFKNIISSFLLESPGASSVDFSEPNTPKRRLSDKSKDLLRQREEIKRNYIELQRKLQREFESKQMEWERLRPALSSSPGELIN